MSRGIRILLRLMLAGALLLGGVPGRASAEGTVPDSLAVARFAPVSSDSLARVERRKLRMAKERKTAEILGFTAVGFATLGLVLRASQPEPERVLVGNQVITLDRANYTGANICLGLSVAAIVAGLIFWISSSETADSYEPAPSIGDDAE